MFLSDNFHFIHMTAQHNANLQSPALLSADVRRPGLELTEFTARSDSKHVHVRITPKLTPTRVPLALVAMIDVSGSMSENACQSVPGMESVDVSRLSLVKHALRTILEVLSGDDQLVLITFSSTARVALPPTALTPSGKAAATAAISSMTPTEMTNIWAALDIGLKVVAQFDKRCFNTALLLFTDGEPNQNPPLGIVQTLKNALGTVERNFTISTFAFGYGVDSDLMEQIARIGDGVYGYCPDCTMVGTIFINFLANALATLVPRAVLEIHGPRTQTKHVLTLMNGSSRNVLVDLPDGGRCEVILTIGSGDRFSTVVEPIGTEADRIAMNDQIYRQRYIDVITAGLSAPARGAAQTQELFDEIVLIADKTPFLDALLVDLVNPHPNHGQIAKGFEKDNFGKWGKDFLRSHMLFHMVEQCGNFKDESLQLYGGAKFAEHRAKANTAFLALPPPEPRRRTSAAPVVMDPFYDYDGGCFDGNAIVALVNGAKRVRELVKGDVLAGGGVVECVVETISNHRCQAVILNGVVFTPFHPVNIGGVWVFPQDIAPVIDINIESWFNLVVTGQKTVVLNGVSAITLGHGMFDGVLAHPYFGTDLVVDALKKYPAYDSGRLRIDAPAVCQRDGNGMIVALF
jgi:Mg-chelatase subunit ChlD